MGKQEKLLFGETPLNFFKENLEQTLSERQVDVSKESIFYVACVMDNIAKTENLFQRGNENLDKKPLAFVLKDAFEGDSFVKYEKLKTIGDFTLAVSGFFQDGLTRINRPRLVEYYSDIGASSYDALSLLVRAEQSVNVYGELSQTFEDFRDALRSIYVKNHCRSIKNLFNMLDKLEHDNQGILERELKRKGISLSVH
ncbi:MAG: hypothetical protein ABIA78_04485 [archaeon]